MRRVPSDQPAASRRRARRFPPNVEIAYVHIPDNTNTAGAIAPATPTHQLTYTPAAAVRLITGDPRSGNVAKHVERDVRTLRAAGITPEKIAGRWVVRSGELARFAAAAAATPPRVDRRRREYRHLQTRAEVSRGR